MLALALLVGLWAGPASPEGPAEREALLALDVRDGSAADVLTALAEAAGLQAVVDPGVTCRLTLKVNGLPFPRAFSAVLGACALGYEGEGQFVRIAPLARLRQEAADRRRLAEAQRDARPRQEVRLRLSYARAAEMAPKLKGFLSPRGEVVFDERTNTLILMDHGQP